MRREELAPGLLWHASQGIFGRLGDWSFRRAVKQRIELDSVLEWRRLAPGGVPLWVVPDADLEATIDRLAASSRARTVELTYYLAEFDRRQRRRLNSEIADANRQMVVLTRAVVALTGTLLVLTVVSTVALVA